ncbi:MAG: hypothetical protein Q9191_005845 [Dirinaria sp. TL-2023a]
MDGTASAQEDGNSDYGSEINSDEEVSLTELLQQISSKEASAPPLNLQDIEDNEGPRGARLPRWLGRERRDLDKTLMQMPNPRPTDKIAVEIESYRSASAPVESAQSRGDRSVRGASAEPSHQSPVAKSEAPDLRSPLERFRTRPMKALSVTDLVSPSWCELQYWYTLTKHGKKRRTPAMKQGSAVHKTLEDQVHRTVEVEIKKSEDAWGLRIWNIIQGLRTLRETGMTRELELWGIVDGQVVNGVIDELSYMCPDRELEEASEKPKQDAPSEDQATIDDFLRGNGGQSMERGFLKRLSARQKKTPRIYLIDVKTRGVKSVPKGASFRPTMMQLMLYHRLLSNLATNKVDSSVLFARYALDPNAAFSDSFVAQIGNLNEIYYDASSDLSPLDPEEPPPSTQDSMSILLEHNSLAQLWQLMIQDFEKTMPDGVNSVGKVLKAEYRGQADGELMGTKTFLYDERILQDYLEDEMRWWKGERDARGVDISEAYKCGYCEFAEECTWRKNKIEEATEAHRKRNIGQRSTSSV